MDRNRQEENRKTPTLDEVCAMDPDRQETQKLISRTLDYQREVLGVLMTDAKTLRRFGRYMRPSYFTFEAHGAICKVLLDHWNRYETLPTKAALESGVLEELDGKDEAVKLLYTGELNTLWSYYTDHPVRPDIDDCLVKFLTEVIELATQIKLAQNRDKLSPEQRQALRDEMQKAIDDIKHVEWPDPKPLASNDLPPFPVGALDVAPAFREIVKKIGHHIQVPTDLPATVGLAVLSVATQGRVRIEVRPGAHEHAVLWTLCGLPPGERKTACVNRLKKPLKDWEAADEAEKIRTVLKAKAEREYLKDKRGEAVKSLKTATRNTPEYDKALNAVAEIDMALAAPEPVRPRLLIDDATPESMVRFLEQQKYRAAVIADESTFLEIILGRYSDSPNSELCLGAWSGVGMPVDRVGREPIVLPEAYLTLGLCIQPAPLKKVAGNGTLSNKGFVQRFLMSLPRSMMGERQQVMEAFPEHVQNDWDELVLRILDGRKRVLTHSPEGWKLLQEIEARYEPLLKENGPLRAISGWVGKAFVGQVIRVAAVLHVASGIPDDVVPVGTLRAAHEIVRYYLEHALHIHDILQDDTGLDAAQKMLETITTKKLAEFKYSYFSTQFWNLRSSGQDILGHAYERLQEAGYIRPKRYLADRKTGEARVASWNVNPKLHLAEG